ncbi:ABC-type dipeptide/oligopeptide/nickel transport system permease subunit [Paenibacillus sp. V4I7]|nr:ABC-type dipeptide/oligopeptide/nickel transport system permease subunit [Paenibacillus sp. V4I7]
MRKLISISRIMVGVLCLILGGYVYIWWDSILMESGGPDHGSRILMVVPNFLAMVLVVFGLVLLIQEMIRYLRKASRDR